MNNEPRLEKRYVGESNWNPIPYQQAIQELNGYYRFPEIVIGELNQDTTLISENRPKIRTPWAFYRIAQ